MDPIFSSIDDARSQKILSITALNAAVAQLLEHSFPLVWVAGEISNLTRAHSGHWYFSLKDQASQVRCVMFRARNQAIDWPLREGDRIEARVLVGLYTPRGDFQLNVEYMRRAGAGSLYEQFLRLKQKLQQAGWFDASHKQALPRFPRAIGVVTSLQAAALRDVLSTLHRRAPHIPVVIYPSAVQGTQAPANIVSAIHQATQRARQYREIDVLLIVRGGGSIEDLWAFNDEAVAQALHACPIPIVSGIGHESDFTIADFVADVRAPTPTAAAELASPQRDQLIEHLRLQSAHLARAMQQIQQRAAQRIDYVLARFKNPQQQCAAALERLVQMQQRLTRAMQIVLTRVAHQLELIKMRVHRQRLDLTRQQSAIQLMRERLERSMRHSLAIQQRQLDLLTARLTLLDPANILARGYALVSDSAGNVVRNAKQLSIGEHLNLALAQGSAEISVVSVTSGPPAKSA